MTLVNICWFRRDLRLHDNAALYYALLNNNPVIPIFIFDGNILDDLEEKTDRRVQFIHEALQEMQQQLIKMGSSLEVYHGYPAEVFKTLLKKYSIEKVFINSDYEQYAIDRDTEVSDLVKDHGASLHSYKDHVIFEKSEVIKDGGGPYTVYTPYSRKWKAGLNDFYLKPYPAEKYFSNFFKQDAVNIPALESMGFKTGNKSFPLKSLHNDMLAKYKEQHDYPYANGTSRLSVHVRFGTISIRELARKAKSTSETFLNELVWRDFYHSILWHFPQVRKGQSFKREYDLINWRNDEKEFAAWCNGKTGYPLADAGMRELNETGYMHNRLRMITASFLTKHLLIDWRWGETYFAKKLLDFDYAANNGGWQWAAGSGCDAAPYFRIFNPALQAKKFDKDFLYIKKWVPEYNSPAYPEPVVVHEEARKRALRAYSEGLGRK